MIDKSKQLESEQWFTLTLQEITFSFGITEEFVYTIIDEGIISTNKNQKNELEFDSEAFRKIRTVWRLHQDLGVNIAGAAVILDLLEELDRLRKS